jgi:hypothetical protein
MRLTQWGREVLVVTSSRLVVLGLVVFGAACSGDEPFGGAQPETVSTSAAGAKFFPGEGPPTARLGVVSHEEVEAMTAAIRAGTKQPVDPRALLGRRARGARAVVLLRVTSLASRRIVLDDGVQESVVTDVVVELIEQISGTDAPPKTYTILGGEVGDLVVSAPHAPRLEVGQYYLVVFSGGPRDPWQLDHAQRSDASGRLELPGEGTLSREQVTAACLEAAP